MRWNGETCSKMVASRRSRGRRSSVVMVTSAPFAIRPRRIARIPPCSRKFGAVIVGITMRRGYGANERCRVTGGPRRDRRLSHSTTDRGLCRLRATLARKRRPRHRRGWRKCRVTLIRYQVTYRCDYPAGGTEHRGRGWSIHEHRRRGTTTQPRGERRAVACQLTMAPRSHLRAHLRRSHGSAPIGAARRVRRPKR